MTPWTTPHPNVVRSGVVAGLAAIAALLLATGAAGGFRSGERTPSPLAVDAVAEDPLKKAGAPEPARVVWGESRHVVRGRTVHPALATEMLEWGLRTLLDAGSAEEAWGKVLSPTDVVGIKFDPVCRLELCDSSELGAAIAQSLLRAGWNASQIVLIDSPAGLAGRFNTQPALDGYQPAPKDFGAVSDQVRRVSGQVTAIISVATLKHDARLGVRASLANVTLGLVRHPARFETSDDGEAIAAIAADPLVRSRVRLCIVDAMRVLIDGGPLAYSSRIHSPGVVLMATDPVAADRVGLELINNLRGAEGLTTMLDGAEGAPLLQAAHRGGLGVAVLRGIDIARAEF